jgi:hypothetical protein
LWVYHKTRNTRSIFQEAHPLWLPDSPGDLKASQHVREAAGWEWQPGGFGVYMDRNGRKLTWIGKFYRNPSRIHGKNPWFRVQSADFHQQTHPMKIA